MKKKIISIIIVSCMLFCIVFSAHIQKAHADALTLSMIGGVSYALMSDWGISFTAAGMSGSGASNFITNQLNQYVASEQSSIGDLFGSHVARVVAGKLVVGAQLYNGIKSFVNWLIDKFGLNSSDSSLSKGTVNGEPLSETIQGTIGTTAGSGIGICFTGNTGGDFPGYASLRPFREGNFTSSWASPPRNHAFIGTYYFTTTDGSVVTAWCQTKNYNTGQEGQNYYISIAIPGGSIENVLNWNGTDYSSPTVLNPDYQWTGTIGGQDWPDTNIDELIGSIYDDVSDNNLDIDGTVGPAIDPEPTPRPTTPPAADILGGINEMIGQLDGLGNDIGDISGHLDDLGDSIEDQNDILGDIKDGIDSIPSHIQSQTGTISGAISQATSDIVGSIEDTADSIETLTDSITDALDVPSAAEATTYKFNLSTLFPFCIPFDIARMLNAFDGVAAAPHFRIPINISSIGFSYTMDLDFAIFDPVATLLRRVELIAFGIALAFATSKVIRW